MMRIDDVLSTFGDPPSSPHALPTVKPCRRGEAQSAVGSLVYGTSLFSPASQLIHSGQMRSPCHSSSSLLPHSSHSSSLSTFLFLHHLFPQVGLVSGQGGASVCVISPMCPPQPIASSPPPAPAPLTGAPPRSPLGSAAAP